MRRAVQELGTSRKRGTSTLWYARELSSSEISFRYRTRSMTAVIRPLRPPQERMQAVASVIALESSPACSLYLLQHPPPTHPPVASGSPYLASPLRELDGVRLAVDCRSAGCSFPVRQMRL